MTGEAKRPAGGVAPIRLGINIDHIATLPGLLHSTTRDVFLYRGKSP